MSGSRRGAGAAVLRALLSAASVPYAAVTRLRRWAHRARLLPSDSLAKYSRPGSGHPVRVISVGNITAGGTGKTPMAAWMVHRLKHMQVRPAVLTRGYKSAGGVSDEAELLRTLCPDTPVVVNPDRFAGAQQAMGQGAEAMVLDDGFQHLRLRRDLDIVLIDATDPFGYGRCLPRGLLREPLSALRDADAIVITRSDLVGRAQLDDLRSRLARLAPKASVHLAVHKATHLIDEGGAAKPVEELAGRPAFAFCGIGNPAGFFAALEALGASLSGRVVLDDHVSYSAELVGRLGRQARDCGAELAVTTQKDAVKLKDAELGLPIWQLAVEMEFVEGEAELVEKIRRLCAAHERHRDGE